MTSLLGRGTRRDTSTRPDRNPGEARALVGVALRPTGVAIVLLSAVVLVTLVSSNSDLTGAVGAIAASWLALQQVSLTITDAPLGILPLLPTAVLMWVVARGCARAVEPESDLRAAAKVVGAAVAGPLAATLIALAVVTDASAVTSIGSPNALAAIACVLVIHLSASAAGVVSVVGRIQCAAVGAPAWLPSVARLAVRAALLLFAAGSAVAVISLVWSWSEVGTLLGEGGGVLGVLGLTLLSVLYLPNLAVGAVAVLLGGTAQAGGTTLSVFDIVPGPVPPMPVLGGVPVELAGSAWPVLLLVPVAVGALLGRDCGRLLLPLQDTAYTVLAAAAGAGVLAAAVGFVAGGDVGAYGFVGVEPWALGLLTFGWLVLPALAVATVLARRNSVEPDAETVSDGESGESVEPGETGVSGEFDTPEFEVKRLALPAMRYRSEPDPELEPETGVAPESPAESGDPVAEGPASGEALDAEVVDDADPHTQDADEGPAEAPLDVIEAEVETETDDSVKVKDAPASPAANEGDLPDGPVPPRD
ncbi:DUF6350 family protein [Rhodococcus sp. OK519]|uniref:cell division protein PerM n=1 Tax=Rhodococcus sp. OK519 TaxID=2135729 RepID=UPI001C625336